MISTPRPDALRIDTPRIDTPRTGTPWLPYRRAHPQARMRLFCFPHAGGGASAFRPWVDVLPPWVDLCPVELPGRESRAAEALVHDHDRLVTGVVEAVAPALDLPFVLFGHSLGALLAFEVATALRERGLPGPERLVVSACRPPHAAVADPGVFRLPDDDLLQYVLGLDGMPAELTEHPDLLAFVLPVLRTDFRVSCTYRYRGGVPLDCPISVLGGRSDRTVTPAALRGWALHTRHEADLSLFPGGHFYLRETPAPLGAVVRLLHRALRAADARTSVEQLA